MLKFEKKDINLEKLTQYVHKEVSDQYYTHTDTHCISSLQGNFFISPSSLWFLIFVTFLF